MTVWRVDRYRSDITVSQTHKHICTYNGGNRRSKQINQSYRKSTAEPAYSKTLPKTWRCHEARSSVWYRTAFLSAKAVWIRCLEGRARTCVALCMRLQKRDTWQQNVENISHHFMHGSINPDNTESSCFRISSVSSINNDFDISDRNVIVHYCACASIEKQKPKLTAQDLL